MSSPSTVYVVDDDYAVRESLALSLRTAGLTVETFASAEEFLRTYQPGAPGCVVLDVRMPSMNGLELQETLSEKQCNIPIIFITGHGSIPMSVRAVKRGAVDFLEKPLSKQLLLERIEEALEEDARVRRDQERHEAVRQRFSRLTPREQEVMALVVAGHSNKRIAQKLSVSPRTIDIHRAHLMAKMESASLADLVAMAVICGIYEPDLN